MLDYLQFLPFKMRTSSRNKMRIVNKSGILTHVFTPEKVDKNRHPVCVKQECKHKVEFKKKCQRAVKKSLKIPKVTVFVGHTCQRIHKAHAVVC